jgi:hypothetical protein
MLRSQDGCCLKKLEACMRELKANGFAGNPEVTEAVME